MSGNILNRCIWGCIVGAVLLTAAQSVQSAEFFSQMVESFLVPWTHLTGTPEASHPSNINGMQASDYALYVGKVALASVAALMGLVLIVRVLISRAIGSMMDG